MVIHLILGIVLIYIGLKIMRSKPKPQPTLTTLDLHIQQSDAMLKRLDRDLTALEECQKRETDSQHLEMVELYRSVAEDAVDREKRMKEAFRAFMKAVNMEEQEINALLHSVEQQVIPRK